MAHKALRQSARTARSLPAALTTSRTRADGTRAVVVLKGEADFSTRPTLSDVLSGDAG